MLEKNGNNWQNERALNRTVYDPNLFMDIFVNWYSKFDKDRSVLNHLNDSMTTLPTTLSFIDSLNYEYSTYDHFEDCKTFYTKVRSEYEPVISIINKISFVIISIGILFNILNLVVLCRTKLNESPYTYLTFLALSDLGALSSICLEKLRHVIGIKLFIENFFIIIVMPLINIFLSCSMYVTLALTIERFIFVHMPFRSKIICNKKVARRVCVIMVIISITRSMYLPFMYTKSECVPDAWVQMKHKGVDIYEFLVSLAIPYMIIFIVNISLIVSLKKQNNLMRHTTFSNHNTIILSKNSKKKRQSSNRLKDSSNKPSKLTNEAPNGNTTLLETNSKNDIKQNSSDLQMTFKSSVYTTSSRSIRVPDTKIFYRTSNRREYRNQKKLTISLIFILCSLLFCYFPSFLFEESLIDALFGELKYDLSDESAWLLKFKGLGTRISLALIYINCSSNFLIYCISNERFNKSLKSLIKYKPKQNSILNETFKSRVIRANSTNRVETV